MSKKYLSVITLIIILLINCTTVWGSSNFDLVRQTDHFNFYCKQQDQAVLDDLENIMEQNFPRISERYNTTVTNKIVVEIYPNQTALRFSVSFLGIGAPGWMVGIGKKGKIKILSPLNPDKGHDYDGMLKVAVHEMTHIIIQTIRYKKIPTWLNEGVALYEAGQMDETRTKKLRQKVMLGMIPSFENLENSFSKADGYTFSASIIEMIIQEYGIEKLNRLIRDYPRFNEILGVTKDELWKQWNTFLHSKYDYQFNAFYNELIPFRLAYI
jgi:hypothetical protein